MRRRQLKWLWARLKQLSAMTLTREDLLMKLGAAKQKAPSAWRLIKIEVDKHKPPSPIACIREKLRTARRREGRYLLRTNLTESDPAKLWSLYLQLVAVEEAFKNLKGDLAVRPIFHQNEKRVEAHIFVSFLAYCLHVTLGQRLRTLAPGLTATQCAGEVRRRADDRRASAHHRRSRDHSHAHHPTRARTKIAVGQTQATTTGTTAAQDQRRSSHLSHCPVVQTFGTSQVDFSTTYNL